MTSTSYNPKLIQDKKFWQTRLKEKDFACAPLPDFDRPAQTGVPTGEFCFDIPATLVQAIEKLTQGPFLRATVLLAGFMVCLKKHTGSDTINVGTPARKEGDNVLPIHLAIRDDMSFRDLLLSLRQTLLDCYDHQAYRYDALLADLGQNVLPNRFALFDVAFVDEAIHGPLPAINNDLTLRLCEQAGVLRATFFYQSSLYRHETMEELAAQFIHLCQCAMEETTQTIAALQLAAPARIKSQTDIWNKTTKSFADQCSAIHLFEEQVFSRPQTPSLVYKNNSITYKDCKNEITAIAHHLHSRGIGKEKIVAVCLKNPLNAVLSFLGIMKAGGAFLPLDPTYPDDRLNYMVADSGCALIIGDEEAKKRIQCEQADVISFDLFNQTPPDCQLSEDIGPNTLAYVVYTSGSTGKPKGTLLEHRGLCNLIQAQGHAFGITPTSQVLQFATLSFDASVSEIFVTLCNGATLHLADRDDMAPVAPLLNLLQERKITHVTLPPSLLGVLPDNTDLPALTTLIVAGEACPVSLAEKWAKGRTLLNGYGPTESTVCATIGHYKAGEKLLIGRPIDNTRIHILDKNLNPVPIGVAGEIHIDSVGLARGYLNRPDLTAERFINNPFPDGFGDRLYKTGDVGRWQANGEIEYLGRNDHQIKLRGFRIELDEIASCLNKHHTVDHAHVLADQNDRDMQILAFVSGANLDAQDLMTFAQTHLPDFMCPARIIIIEEFPKTPNGKIDRAALLNMKHHGTKSSHDIALARDTVELKLLHIWQDLLDTAEIGIDDDFFAKGGHSLLAVRLIGRVERTFDIKIALDQFFRHATVRQFAPLVRQSTQNPIEEWSPLVPVLPNTNPKGTPLFCIHPAGGRVLCYLPFARALGDEVSVLGLQARGLEKGQQPFDGLTYMVDCYYSAIKTAYPDGPYNIVGWSGGGVIAYALAKRLQDAGNKVPFLAMLDAYAPPALPQHLKDMDDAALVKSLLSAELGDTSSEDLRRLSAEELITHMRKTLIESDILPAEYDEDDVARFFEVYKLNCKLAHSDIASAFDGTIHLFRAIEEQGLQASYAPDDPTLGWHAFSNKGVNDASVPGDHNTMMEAPHVDTLAQLLKTCLTTSCN